MAGKWVPSALYTSGAVQAHHAPSNEMELPAAMQPQQGLAGLCLGPGGLQDMGAQRGRLCILMSLPGLQT